MLDGVNKNLVIACEEIKKIVTPELRDKIENKNLLRKDVAAIARTVLVKRNEDGSFSVERRDLNQKSIALPNEDIIKMRQEIALIRNICTFSADQSVEAKIVGKKRKLENEEPAVNKLEEEPISIIRNKRKANVVEEEQPAKKPKLAINEISDMFSEQSEIADAILAMIAEYNDESTRAIIDFVTKEEKIPEYLKKNMSYLNFPKTSLLDLDTFTTIIKQFENLKSIKLPMFANDSWMTLLSVILPKLERLDISQCKSITNKAIQFITKHMKSLKELNLAECSISDKTLDIIFKELRLQTLNIKKCTGITDEAFKNIRESGESLQNLDLSETEITDRGLFYITDGVKGIKRLDLTDSSNFSDLGLDSAIQSFTNLEYLNVSFTNITDKGMVNLNQRHNTLQKLQFDGCHGVTGEFLSHFDRKFEALKEFSLTLSRNFQSSNLNHIVGRFPELEILDLEDIKGVDDELIGSIVQGMVKLENLQLSGTNVGNTGLTSIAFECPNLKELIFFRSTQPINEGINAIFNGCKMLQELSLSSCDIDDSVFEINETRKLIRLRLEQPVKLSSKGFSNISKSFPDLKSINLSKRVVTNSVRSILTESNKDLQINLCN